MKDCIVADFGVLFMHTEGYSTMCGHGTIALVTALLETGVVDPRDSLGRGFLVL